MDIVDQALLRCMIDLKRAKVADIVKYVHGDDQTGDIRKTTSHYKYRLTRMVGIWLDYNMIKKEYKLREFVIGPGELYVYTPHGVFRLESETTIIAQTDNGGYIVEYLEDLTGK